MLRSCRRTPTRRPGTIIPFLGVSMIGLCGFLALAIDVGMLTIAKTQCQNAADVAALTAARTLNGNSSVSPYNSTAATANAQAIVGYNTILQQPIQSSQLTLTYGSFSYNPTTQTFYSSYPPTSGEPWAAVQATVVSTSLPAAFSTVFGLQALPNVTCTAQAAHRPRDIALVMDLSASMQFGTSLGFDFYGASRSTNNQDTNVPTFAQYSGGNSTTYLTYAPTETYTAATRTSAADSYTIPPTNTTLANTSYSLTYINSFYSNAAYASTLVRAFDSYTSTNGGSTWTAPAAGATPQLPPASYTSMPGGDVPLYEFGSTTTYAQTLNQVLNNSSTNTAANILWELDGYSAYAGGKPDTSGTGSTPQVWAQADYSAPANPPANGSLPFNGYTQGPGYYGVTYFMWPPDPRTTTALSNTVSGSNLSPLQAYLYALGISNTKASGQTQTDVVTLASIWSTWQTAGATGLAKLKSWLDGGTAAATGAAYAASINYLTAKTTVPTTNWSGKWNNATVATANLPLTYYAVCRLFNRAYPGGTAWTSTSFSADWRMRFYGTTTDNTTIFNSSGSLNPPGTSGMWPSASTAAARSLLTYNAILSWLSTIPANPFPAMMRAGRIKYYGSMPNGTTTPITGTWPSYGGTDQQFWVETIDHMLGFLQTASATYTDLTGTQSSSTQMIGYGGDITWGTETTNAVPTVSGTTMPPYMSYKDNPLRPLLRTWFSPITMVDRLHNCNMWLNESSFYYKQPADCYEAPLYVAKEAYVAAITTMELNHPNDWFTVVPYNYPRTSATSVGAHNCVLCPLGQNYAYATSALLFPFSTINANGTCNNTEVTPYDADPSTGAVPSSAFVDIAKSDGYTCFAMGLMLAYNQFACTPVTDTTLTGYVTSSPITFPTGMAGGLGRVGAQKVVIFETDGLADCEASATLVTSSNGYSYYKILYNMNSPSTSQYPTGVTTTAINASSTVDAVYTLVQQLSTTYGTTRNPFKLYAIGFGPIFTGPDASSALATLQTMQYYGNTQTSTSTALPSTQIITGTAAQMSANMVSAFTSILENGVQIALIQ